MSARLLDCSFASAINLNEATAVSVRLSGSHLPSVRAKQLRTRGDLRLDEGFSVSDGAELVGAHIGGQLDCSGGHFANPDGVALSADWLVVDGGMFCRQGFSATGEVRLARANIGGQLDCSEGQFANPDRCALNLERATVSGPLNMESAVLQGILDLTAATTSSYFDNSASWPQNLRLDRFVYDAIEGASVKERLDWLHRNKEGYLPQIYEQLATVYRRTGHDEAARLILLTKERQHSAQGNLGSRAAGFWLDWTVGYGYRTWLAGVWLVVLVFVGSVLFGYVVRDQLTPASKTAALPPFQPVLYTLDLLIPVVSLHVRDAWIAYGAAQWLSWVFIAIGWVLTTALILRLTALLKRD